MEHVDENAILELAAGRLARDARARLDAHVDRCTACRELVAALARGPALCEPSTRDDADAFDDDDGPLARGDTLGRFVVLSRLGSGASGVVYAAHDPELDRKIAIKLLHGELGAHADARARIVGEARALAKLADPGVVRVYDVGTFGEQVFVAMELVDGVTLTDWLAEPRPWRDIRDVVVRAGRGLAAAHRAGLVHRDIKPDNILVGRDGRVCIGDFGLAQEAGASAAAAGTPVYMAPEQLAGAAADARSDQFSLGVTLYEALYARRPFAGRTLDELARAIARGPELEPPRGRIVPAHVRQLLARALAAEPDRRFSDVDALVRALARDPARMRARIALAIGALVAVAGGAAALGAYATRTDACDDGGDRLAWNEGARVALARAFIATGRAHVPQTLATTTAALDRYATGWREQHLGACVAHRRGEQSDELFDRRMACLERRRSALAAFVGVLRAADAEVVDGAHEALAQLPALVACGDVDALRAAVPPPDDPARRAAAAGITARLAEVSALQAAGKAVAARERVAPIVADARVLAVAQPLAEALVVQGELDRRLSHAPAAEPVLYEAVQLAATAHDDDTTARALTDLVDVVGFAQARHGDADLLARMASAAAARAGGSAESDFALALGDLRWSEGRYGDAEAAYRRAIASVEARSGRDHVDLIELHSHLGNALDDEGRFAEARGELVAARTLSVKLLGADHPTTAGIDVLLGRAIANAGDYKSGRAYLDRALATLIATYGEHQASVAQCLDAIGATAADAGALDEARVALERALAIREAIYRDGHPNIAQTHGTLGTVLVDAGRYDEARTHLERALALYRASLGNDHPEVANALANLARLELAVGNYGKARADYDEALALARRVLGENHASVATLLANRAALLADTGHSAEALADFKKVLAIEEATVGHDHANTASVIANIASLLPDPAEAIKLHEEALAIRRHVLGEQHPDVGNSHHELAVLLLARGDLAAADDHARRALAITEASLGPAHPDTGAMLALVGRVALAQRRFADAVTALDRALAIYRRAGTAPARIAAAERDLARARAGGR